MVRVTGGVAGGDLSRLRLAAGFAWRRTHPTGMRRHVRGCGWRPVPPSRRPGRRKFASDRLGRLDRLLAVRARPERGLTSTGDGRGAGWWMVARECEVNVDHGSVPAAPIHVDLDARGQRGSLAGNPRACHVFTARTRQFRPAPPRGPPRLTSAPGHRPRPHRCGRPGRPAGRPRTRWRRWDAATPLVADPGRGVGHAARSLPVYVQANGVAVRLWCSTKVSIWTARSSGAGELAVAEQATGEDREEHLDLV